MKKILSFVLAIALLVPVFANTFVYAKGNDVCSVNGNAHDYSYRWSLSEDHPHEGYVECKCGDIIYSDKMIFEDCETCQNILCQNGIHNYLANVFSTYGICNCGKTIEMSSSENEFYSHLEHFENGNWYSSCYFCNMNDDYYESCFDFVVKYAIKNGSHDEPSSFDDTYTEDVNEAVTHTGNSHDLHPSIHQNLTHPHKGFLECSCGLRSYFDSSISAECTECRDEPCNVGIHYYTYEVYLKENTVYTTCYCGKTISVDCTYREYNEHLGHTDSVFASCPICMLGIECSTSYFEYITESVMSNWEEPIPDEIYYAEDEVNNSTTFNPEPERHSFTSYNCNVISGEHDFTAGGRYSAMHPHAGSYTCFCEEELYYQASYLEECSQCRIELCNSGIHDFSYELHYSDSTKKSGYGSCHCGATMDFTKARDKYNSYCFDLSSEKYKVPCASCTFKAIFSNELIAFQTNKLQNTDTISAIYSDYDITYAYNHYADVTKHTYNWNCTHPDCYLENKPEPVVTPPIVSPPITNKPNVSNNNSTVKPTTNTNSSVPSSTNNNSSQAPSIELDPYYQYDLPMYQEMVPLEIADVETQDALDDFLDQFFLGNYAEKVTLAGTIGEIAFSFTGLDAYKDITDLWYNLTHWENSWKHFGSTLLNVVAVLPIVGIFKNSDELAMVNKLGKLDPDTLNLLKKIGGVNADVLLKIKKLSSADIYKLVTKLDGHALTKHVGNVSAEALQELRHISKSGTKGPISSFYTEEDALKIIEAALKDNNTIATIAAGINSSSSKFPVTFNYGKTTGVHIAKNSDTVNTVNKVTIVIQPISKTEFYIKTAYPIP